jgi:NTP pyrophosphatase (non-canonical NTP hydrolase)
MAAKTPGTIKALTKLVIDFRDARDWKQFNNSKDTALSLVLEAAEVLEHFQWKNGAELEAYARSHKHEIGEELADVLAYAFQLAHDLDIDLPAAFVAKMKQNGKKYPVAKSRGRHVKYTEL